MMVFLNGRLVPETEAMVSVFDRSFLYGDGLFETIRVYRGKPFRWTQHLERLGRGAAYLRIQVPYTPDEMRQAAEALIRQNQAPNAVLRLTLSRGVGRRGYSVQGADRPVLAMTVHPAADGPPQTEVKWRLKIASIRVAVQQPLANIKTCNKLAQILARAEAEAAGADEGLLLNSRGEVAEAAGSNLFWVNEGAVGTVPLHDGALEGVTRALVLALCARLGMPARELSIRVDELVSTGGVFLTLSSLGVVEAVSLDDRPLRQADTVKQLQRAYREALEEECG